MNAKINPVFNYVYSVCTFIYNFWRSFLMIPTYIGVMFVSSIACITFIKIGM